MNTNKILNKLTLWKDIDNFYSFNELVKLSRNYCEGVRILFASLDGIYDFNILTGKDINPLNHKTEICLEITYNELFFMKLSDNDPNNLNKMYNPWHNKDDDWIFFKNNFKNEFKVKVLNRIKSINFIKKFCLLNELYNNILEGANI